MFKCKNILLLIFIVHTFCSTYLKYLNYSFLMTIFDICIYFGLKNYEYSLLNLSIPV